MGFTHTLILLAGLFVLAHTRDKCDARPPFTTNKDGDYDFIICGGGTAGAIVAARLSAQYNVLLLESGDRLYDDAVQSAKYFTQIMTGLDTATTVDALNPLLKGVGSFSKDGDVLDADGKKVGDVQNGIPGYMPHLQGTPFMALFLSMSEASHYYPTVPQIYSQKREMVYPRGNMLGGSSGSNTMVYFRGTPRDFDEWENDLGLTGWGYQSVLPYFKKFENNQDVSDPSVHGHSGLINITIVKNHFGSPATDEYTRAAIKMGYKKIEDASNPETQYGASDSWQCFVGQNGRRSDSSAYIRDLDLKGKVCWNQARKDCKPGQNLNVWTRKYVTKVLVDESNRAYGVEFVSNAKEHEQDRSLHPNKDKAANEGVKHHTPYNKWDKLEVQKKIETLGAPVSKELAFDWARGSEQYIPETKFDYSKITQRVTAKYEVVLSAGTVATGQILMLSGIGPADHLREKSLKTIADLPVGKRLQDHQEVISAWKFPKSTKPEFNIVTETTSGFPQLRAHLRGERSFFSMNGVPAGLEGSSAGPSGSVPKWHLHHITVGGWESFDYNLAAYPESVKTPFRLPRSLAELYLWRGQELHLHNCELSQNHAYGRLELRNADPFQPPFLDPRYGSSDEDNAEVVHCLETVRELMKLSDPKFVGEELEPSASAKTKEQLNQYVRNTAWGHHISGSAPLGNCSTWYAVTDKEAKVYLVGGLRVADLSLFPTIPHGNPAAVGMMIGEKVADMILKEHGSKTSKDEL